MRKSPKPCCKTLLLLWRQRAREIQDSPTPSIADGTSGGLLAHGCGGVPLTARLLAAAGRKACSGSKQDRSRHSLRTR
jgi:hypothetical protein